jgi:hypothetical protein
MRSVVLEAEIHHKVELGVYGGWGCETPRLAVIKRHKRKPLWKARILLAKDVYE